MSIKKTRNLIGFGKRRIIILAIVAIAIILFCVVALHTIHKSVIDLKGVEKEYLYIPTGSTYDDVHQLLTLKGWLSDESTFALISDIMNYSENVKAGRFEIIDGMSARALINRLRGGQQAPVNVTFNNVRLLTQLAGIVSRNIEADSVELLNAMTDNELIGPLGFNKNTMPAMFVPNTYQFMWNTSGKQWVERMNIEYKKFWNEQRLHKADSIGLTPIEVSIIASIVEEETNRTDEYPIIAGIYINRLRKNMLLQACPTLKYALGDFARRRILDKDKEVDSPYNTYKNIGLPPGPIRIPSIACVDAVLNAADHQYLFMCAKPDNSGGHNFARTNAEHSRNAAIYQKYLNKRQIYK